MNRKWDRGLAAACVAVMLVLCLFMAWYVPSRAGQLFRLEDTAKSLETSRGRERKQQYEYDEVTRKLPETRAELAETQPLADAAAEKVRTLKEERRRLREGKKALEQQLAGGPEGEASDE